MQPKITPLEKQKQLHDYLQQVGQHAPSPSDKKEASFISNILTEAAAGPVHTAPVLPTITLPPAVTPPPDSAISPQSSRVPMPSPSFSPPAFTASPVADPSLEENLQKEQKELQEKEEALKKEEVERERRHEQEEIARKKEAAQLFQMQLEAKKVIDENKMTHDKLLELEKTLQDMSLQKQTLEQELLKLRQQAAQPASPKDKAFIPTKVKEEHPRMVTQLIRQIPTTMTKSKGLPPTPDVANILLGVVKDSSGNILPNILIEVKDIEGNPVRAFKTNQLGQFASATPLMNATYTIEFEDTKGKNKFDAIELTAKGEILEPLEVISHDLREELRKQLFS